MGFDTVGKVPTRVDHEGLDVLGCHAVTPAFWAYVDWFGHTLPPCAALVCACLSLRDLFHPAIGVVQAPAHTAGQGEGDKAGIGQAGVAVQFGALVVAWAWAGGSGRGGRVVAAQALQHGGVASGRVQRALSSA